MSSQQLGRRDFLKAAGVTATIIGYSSQAGAWVGEPGPPPGNPGKGPGNPPGHGKGKGPHHPAPFDRVPALDGELLTDAAARSEMGSDLGLIIFDSPRAVLRPGSIEDVVAMVKFCAKHGIEVAARGQGHATHGQAQVKNGLVIDMSALQTIYEMGPGYAVVSGGCTWRKLLHDALRHPTLPPQTPPVLTGYIGLSIGGTLSMGGISGMAYDIGVQVEHVDELTVVTGKGHLEVCSERKNRKLFDHVLSGLGQCGIIVKAKVKLVPAKPLASNTTAVYVDIHTLQEDLRTLVYRGDLDSVYAQGGVDPATGGVVWLLNVASFHDAANPPNTAHFLRDLHYLPGTLSTEVMPYEEYQLIVDKGIDQLRDFGLFEGVTHPWYDVFLPDSELGDYVADISASFQPDDVGLFGFVLLFPLRTSTISRPLFRLPDEELVWLFDVLTSHNVPGRDDAFADNKRERNNVWFEQARALGGTRYPIGTLDFTQEDWKQHYGREWKAFQQAKQQFDPHGILTPGPGIFRRQGC